MPVQELCVTSVALTTDVTHRSRTRVAAVGGSYVPG